MKPGQHLPAPHARGRHGHEAPSTSGSGLDARRGAPARRRDAFSGTLQPTQRLEQLRGEKPTAKTVDVYSAALVLYEIIAGRVAARSTTRATATPDRGRRTSDERFSRCPRRHFAPVPLRELDIAPDGRPGEEPGCPACATRSRSGGRALRNLKRRASRRLCPRESTETPGPRRGVQSLVRSRRRAPRHGSFDSTPDVSPRVRPPGRPRPCGLQRQDDPHGDAETPRSLRRWRRRRRTSSRRRTMCGTASRPRTASEPTPCRGRSTAPRRFLRDGSPRFFRKKKMGRTKGQGEPDIHWPPRAAEPILEATSRRCDRFLRLPDRRVARSGRSRWRPFRSGGGRPDRDRSSAPIRRGAVLRSGIVEYRPALDTGAAMVAPAAATRSRPRRLGRWRIPVRPRFPPPAFEDPAVGPDEQAPRKRSTRSACFVSAAAASNDHAAAPPSSGDALVSGRPIPPATSPARQARTRFLSIVRARALGPPGTSSSRGAPRPHLFGLRIDAPVTAALAVPLLRDGADHTAHPRHRPAVSRLEAQHPLEQAEEEVLEDVGSASWSKSAQ